MYQWSASLGYKLSVISQRQTCRYLWKKTASNGGWVYQHKLLLIPAAQIASPHTEVCVMHKAESMRFWCSSVGVCFFVCFPFGEIGMNSNVDLLEIYRLLWRQSVETGWRSLLNERRWCSLIDKNSLDHIVRKAVDHGMQIFPLTWHLLTYICSTEFGFGLPVQNTDKLEAHGRVLRIVRGLEGSRAMGRGPGFTEEN